MALFKNYFRSPTAIFGLILLTFIILVALTADWIFPGNPLALAGRPLQWPLTNSKFYLGTDQAGRNIAALLFHGARVSLIIGIIATLIAILIGIVIGAISGFYGGWADDILMRFTEGFQILPNFLLLLVAVAIFGSTINIVVIAIGVVSWPPVARLTRAEFLSLRNREFVQAGKTLGMSSFRLMFKEILPNALPPVIMYASVILSTAILMESALAFLNLSDPNISSWGNSVGAGRAVLRQQWYVSAIPGIAILLTVLSASLVGQGLNDTLNPRLKKW
ncbi:ABC transporter permease [Gilliamella sp. wkB112]|uniref:ABC transporter permease n=1 Tax=Gilliamella sp. wkB112 TaxID=3120257 RepID=UPI00080DBC2B|nr:ABC transporter permease [Gilliamella apicola]OCG03976.1 ABC transporter permease [Gilliamella apicola]